MLKVAIAKNIVCRYWFFNNGFKYQDSFCNDCPGLLMLCVNIRDIAIIVVKEVDYRCIFYDISKSETINLLDNACQEVNIKNQVYNYYFDNLVKAKKK